MKHYILPTLLSVLFTGQIFAQRTLSPSVRPYAANWTYTLVKAMNRAGFDMPTMPLQPAAGVASRSPLQLDSTKTFYAYAPGDSTPLFRTTYQYPQTGTKIEINYQYENNAWLPLNRSTLVSDDLQRLVAVESEAFDPETETFQPDSKLEIFPHGDSQVLIDSVFTYLWDSTITDWHIIFSVRNTFDDQDRVLESLTSIEYFGDPLIFQETYSYDDNGDNHLIEEFAILGNDVFPSSRTAISYVDHRPIESTVSVADSAGFVPQSRSNFAYTLFGALRLHLAFVWDFSLDNFRMTQRIEYGFDNEQRVASKETTIIEPNAWDERDLVAYAYVEDENLYSEMFFNWDDDAFDWILDSKKFYYYNGVTSVDPGAGEVQALAAWPNPTTGLVQLSFEDESDLMVFDVAGQLVQSRRVQPGQPLDISGLPAGIYALTARHTTGVYSGKIVKQ